MSWKRRTSHTQAIVVIEYETQSAFFNRRLTDCEKDANSFAEITLLRRPDHEEMAWGLLAPFLWQTLARMRQGISPLMDQTAIVLITIGSLLLLGLATVALGNFTRLPRVTLLLIFGFLIGPSCGNLLVDNQEKWFPLAADMALVMVGFLLGEHFKLSSLRRHGRFVIGISLAVTILTALVVLIGLLLIGVRLEIALILAAASTATDPAAVTDVVKESKASGPFSNILLGIVAVDDAWGLIAFSVLLTIVAGIAGQGTASAMIGLGLWEVGGAILLGFALGLPAAYLTGRIDGGEPSLTEALGVVFLCGGLALWLEVSFLLASMVLGAVVANLARHHTRPFHAIEGIEWPFMIVFFVLAGASLHLDSLLQIGVAGVAYILLRTAGRWLGGWIGGRMSGADRAVRRWMGFALLPQAGVALGMALVAAHRFPELRESILAIVISATVVFEIIGPICTKVALLYAGEIKRKAAGKEAGISARVREDSIYRHLTPASCNKNST